MTSAVELVVFPQLRIPHNVAVRSMQGQMTYAESQVNCACAAGAALSNRFKQQQANLAGASVPALITHHAFRVAAGSPTHDDGSPSGLSSSAVDKALGTLGVPHQRFYAASTDLLYEALFHGTAAWAAIDYGAYNDLMPAGSTGDKRFRGGHAVTLDGFRFAGPEKEDTVRLSEGLQDGRCRSWGCAAHAPTIVAWSVLEQLLGQFRVGGKTYSEGRQIGVGKAIFITVSNP